MENLVYAVLRFGTGGYMTVETICKTEERAEEIRKQRKEEGKCSNCCWAVYPAFLDEDFITVK